MRRYVLSLILLLHVNVTYSQPDLKFARYTTSQGLAHNDVLSVCQDTFGFLWFGTKNGCSRFDGIEFKNYQYDEYDSGSIGPGWVNQIICDSQNRLWFAISGHGGGFMKYNYETDKFEDVTHYIKPKSYDEAELFDVWNLYCDRDEHIWINGTSTGIVIYNPENNNIRRYTSKYYNEITFPNVRSFMEDSAGNMWMATSSGLLIYNKIRNEFVSFKNDSKNPLSISSDDCSFIFQDSDDQIWIGTYNGLNKLIMSSSREVRFKRFMYDSKDPFSISHNFVFSISEDIDNNLFVATLNGLSLLDKKSNKFHRYYKSETDNESVNTNLIRVVFRDQHNNMWIGTSAGIGRLQTKNFQTFSHSSIKNSISHNKIQYICEALNDQVWIATPKGIDLYNKKTGRFRFVLNTSGKSQELLGPPISMFSEKSECMWIGTWQGGVSRYDYATGKITNPIDKYIDLSGKSVFSILVDSKDYLWFGSNREGVYAYNSKTNGFKIFSHDNADENSLISNIVRMVVEDSDGNIWIGTLGGLSLLTDFEKGNFRNYLKGMGINQLIESYNKKLWIIADNKLYKFNKAAEWLKRIDIPGYVLSIVEDDSKNLWVSTNKGIFKMGMSGNNRLYREEEGLNVGGFIGRSYAKLSDGTVMFGGSEGFCMFHPSTIKTDSVPPTVLFTNLEVANKIVKVGQEINGQTILEKSIAVQKHIVFNHKNNAFAIEFVGLQYNLSRYIQYCYKLEGYDLPQSEWHYVNATDRKAEYMNLPYGTYVFKVKAANSYGIWGEATELKITVLPPWWRTIWFISLSIVLVILSVFLIIKRRIYNLQQQKKKLEKVVEQRTKELKEINFILSEQKEQLEQQMVKTEEMSKQLHEADQQKLRFFANVSHEFRTPLSLITGPLEKLLNLKQPILWEKVNVSGYLQLMNKNVKSLLRLINQVIDFRKIEQGRHELHVSNSNIVAFVEEIVEVFTSYAEPKEIVLKFQSQLPVIDCWFDPDVMEKILFNVISNAIKYTPDRGVVSVQLTVSRDQSAENSDQLSENQKSSIKNHQSEIDKSSFLVINVSDTGVGIKQANLNKIFERFYRESLNKTSIVEGTGIGLSYTKELVELHKGTISVESEYGKGSTFTIQFPVKKDSYEEKVINKEVIAVNLEYTRSMFETEEEKKDNNDTSLLENSIVQNKNNPSILVVEDNTDLRKFIKNELSTDYNVFEAQNGEKGVDMAFKIQPELILSDIMMPIMDGMELCKRIKNDENTSHIPVILLTAKDGDENTLQGLKTGADDYITKPFNLSILKLKIQNLFLARQKLREKFNLSIDPTPSEIAHSLIDEKFIQKAIQIVNENMHNYEFDNDAFVDLMNSSRTLVYTKIRSLTGQSVSEFIRSIRLKAAAQFFLNRNGNVAEVCYKVGFKSPSILTRYFTKMFGEPPIQFMKNNSKNKD